MNKKCSINGRFCYSFISLILRQFAHPNISEIRHLINQSQCTFVVSQMALVTQLGENVPLTFSSKNEKQQHQSVLDSILKIFAVSSLYNTSLNS